MEDALAAAARHYRIADAIGLARRIDDRDAHLGAMPVLLLAVLEIDKAEDAIDRRFDEQAAAHHQRRP